jgi:hypothetical protein
MIAMLVGTVACQDQGHATDPGRTTRAAPHLPTGQCHPAQQVPDAFPVEFVPVQAGGLDHEPIDDPMTAPNDKTSISPDQLLRKFGPAIR